MLKSIAALGKTQAKDHLRSLVDRTNAKDVLVIKMDRSCKYRGIMVENNEGEEKYLFKIEKGGRPGKFITGRIMSADLKELKDSLRVLKENPENLSILNKIEKFKRNKIEWMTKSLILKDTDAIKCIPHKSKQLLNCIISEIDRNQDTIMNDLCDKVVQGTYGDVLLTVKIGTKYLKDIDGFPELLQVASQGKELFDLSIPMSSKCIICNMAASQSEHKESLPFYTIDKPNFIPDGISRNSSKVFSLCTSCYTDLRCGFNNIIQDYLNFNIPKTSGRSRLWLWLIPKLFNPALVQRYLSYVKSEKGLASFKEMFKLSQRMDTTRDYDLGIIEMEETDKFLTYTALFYYKERSHMRLVGSVDGIYPSRLKEMAKEKFAVDKSALETGNPFRFHFGLISELLENEIKGGKVKRKDSEGWMKTMAYIMSSLFITKQIDELYIAKMLLVQPRSYLSKHKLKEWHAIMLKVSLIFEYLYRVSTLSTNSHNHYGSNIASGNNKVIVASRFLSTHSGILYTKNLRAICAIGIAVGVIIKAQMRYMNSDSFVSRLNRLEMDYIRLIDLYRQAWPKLKHYKAEEYLELFEYLGSVEISNLEPNHPIQKEIMNLVFAVGMAEGLTLGPVKEKNNDKDE